MKLSLLRNANEGLTLVEVLIVVAGIAVVGSGAVVVTGNIQERLRSQKLVQDVGTINRAIGVYEANGGTMEGVDPHPWYILGQLKSKVAADKVDEAAGLTGRLIDPRLQPYFMSAAEIAGAGPRGVWDPAKRRLVVIYDDSIVGPKIKGFKLTDDTPEEEALTQAFLSGIDARDLNAFGYAKDGKWVWDYEDVSAPAAPTPTEVTLNPPATPTPPGAAPGTTPLDPPAFSIPGGSYALSSYNLSLTLTNPNDPAVSEIHYSTYLGSWVLYTGTPIVVQAGMQVEAVAVSTDLANWTNSGMAREAYDTAAIGLDIALTVPASISYAEAGGVMEPGGVAVTPASPGQVTLVNAADIPLEYQNSQRIQLMWTYDGTDPLALAALEHDPGVSWPPPNLNLGDPFAGGFPGQWVDILLPMWGGQDSLPIQVVAMSTNPEILISSSVIGQTVAIAKMPLRAPQLSAAGGMVTLTKVTALGDMPVGARIFYTLNGTDPGDAGGSPVAGTEYTGPFSVKWQGTANVPVSARVYGPSGYEQWFDVSPVVASTVPVPPVAVSLSQVVSTTAP